MPISDSTKFVWITGTTGNEMIEMESGCRSQLPDFPFFELGATGMYVNDGITICGGENSKNCYQLKKNAISYELVDIMGDVRIHASSIVTEGNMLVTGGADANDNKLGSGEFINQQIPNIQLPYPVFHHAFININQTTSFLIGGSGSHKDGKTYYFNHLSNEWTNGPDLIRARHCHTAGVLIDHDTKESHVAVIAGCTGSYSTTVEILFHGDTTWTEGIVYCSGSLTFR